ncbi:MAG: gas vesicle protein [Solirubrobacterales bacterium]|nr:gas vesicle protein [Solirubrobacterales bacterium]
MTAAGPPRTLYSSTRPPSARSEPVSLVDVLDRVLAGGVVVHGHVTLAVADIDLVDLDIALLVAATATLAGAR